MRTPVDTTRIYVPATQEELAARDALLDAALRGPDVVSSAARGHFGIAAEYPLVLAADARRFSRCLATNGINPAAHANLWPRQLVSSAATEMSTSISIGLVGNVATCAKVRGRGLMTVLFEELCREAREAGLKALLLWSDLQEFYQKLGFRATGRELRFTMRVDALPKARETLRDTVPESPDELMRMLAQRPRIPWTLQRNSAEFARQLRIPGMRGAFGDRGWALMGKGHDMQGVVHEWGGDDVAQAMGAARRLGERAGFERIMVLAPGTLATSAQAELRRFAVNVEEHPMAWSLTLEKAIPELEQAFVWGLDSI